MAAASASENELNILPYVYEVMKSIEKDNNDVAQKMMELKTQFQRARECVNRLPGIEHSQEEQLKVKSVLHQQLNNKTQLLLRYKTNSGFDFTEKTNGEATSNLS